jgi:hypothetical protein
MNQMANVAVRSHRGVSNIHHIFYLDDILTIFRFRERETHQVEGGRSSIRTCRPYNILAKCTKGVISWNPAIGEKLSETSSWESLTNGWATLLSY